MFSTPLSSPPFLGRFADTRHVAPRQYFTYREAGGRGPDAGTLGIENGGFIDIA